MTPFHGLSGHDAVRQMIAGLDVTDDLARRHQREALAWLDVTSDIYRRVKPRTPSPHIVSYFLVVDPATHRVLLCDHRRSGLWLPTGGHVEPGEDPAETVRREAREELGIEARFHPGFDRRPFFLTVTDTVGAPDSRHTDVTLWFALVAGVDEQMHPDGREFAGVRWWTRAELAELDPARREPHLLRALDALDSSDPAEGSPRGGRATNAGIARRLRGRDRTGGPTTSDIVDAVRESRR